MAVVKTLVSRATDNAQYTPLMSTSPSLCITKLPSWPRRLDSHFDRVFRLMALRDLSVDTMESAFTAAYVGARWDNLKRKQISYETAFS